MNETRARIKDALQGVLEEFGIDATTVPGKKQNAIEFWIGGKRYIHSFPSGGALNRVHLNVRSQFRNRLKMLGLQPVPPKMVRQKVQFIPDFEDELPAIRKEARAEEAMAEENAAPKEESQGGSGEPETAKVVPPLKNPVHGRVFQSPRVLAIVLDRELVVEKGNVLVIPLNRPNTILDMTQEQFQLLFEEVLEPPRQEPPPEPAPQDHRAVPMGPRPLPTPKLIMPPPSNQPERNVQDNFEYEFTDEELFAEEADESPAEREEAPEKGEAPSPAMNDIIAYLRQRRGGVKAKVIANALRVTIKSVESNLRLMLNKRIVESDPPGFWALIDKTPPPRRTMQQPHPVSTSRIVQSPRGPVPAQLGRILAAMAYVTKTTGETEMTATMVTKHLSARDAKQYGARMPGALELGYVERGAPLPNVRGSHYRITEKGMGILRKAGTYPYDNDLLPPPPWLNSVLATA